MYGRYQKVLVRVERGARVSPESQNFDGEVFRRRNMADFRAAMGGACAHPRHRHHCPPQVGDSVADAGVKGHFFEIQETLSEGAESKEHSGVMADVIAGDWRHLRHRRLPPPHLHFHSIRQFHPLHPLAHHFRIHLRNFHRDLARYRSLQHFEGHREGWN
jgi:hypothetical protein